METKDLLAETFKFQGHICWASAMGTRVGLVALRELGVQRTGTSDELHCIVEIGDNHGAQCFVDGVQYSTGCTFGKGDIEKAGWGKLAIMLINKNKEQAIRVSYKPGRHKMIAESSFMSKRTQGVPPTQIPQEEAWLNPILMRILERLWGCCPVQIVGRWSPKCICGLWETIICVSRVRVTVSKESSSEITVECYRLFSG